MHLRQKLLWNKTAWRQTHLIHGSYGKPSVALYGGIYISGAAVKWLQKGLKIIKNSSEADKLALSVKDNGGVCFIPAFTGLAALYWDSYTGGMMIGLTAGCTDAHIARVTLEAIAYQVKENTGIAIKSMRTDGGSTASKFLMQFQADLLGIPVEVPAVSETTGLGAAYLAALGMGEILSLEDMSILWRRNVCYEPKMSEDERQFLLEKWHRAVERARDWADK